MIYCLEGTVVLKRAEEMVISCSGVGFRVAVPAGVYASTGGRGERVFLFTHLHVKEDAFDLYGFLSEEALDCFKMLLSVSGVGPKSALSVLSLYSPQQIAVAAASGDHKAFAACSGIGPKLAQRIVLELKDKIGGFAPEETAAVSAAGFGEKGARQEALAALVTLGFSTSEAAAAVAKVKGELPVEEMVSQSLRVLAAR